MEKWIAHGPRPCDLERRGGQHAQSLGFAFVYNTLGTPVAASPGSTVSFPVALSVPSRLTTLTVVNAGSSASLNCSRTCLRCSSHGGLGNRIGLLQGSSPHSTSPISVTKTSPSTVSALNLTLSPVQGFEHGRVPDPEHHCHDRHVDASRRGFGIPSQPHHDRPQPSLGKRADEPLRKAAGAERVGVRVSGAATEVTQGLDCAGRAHCPTGLRERPSQRLASCVLPTWPCPSPTIPFRGRFLLGPCRYFPSPTSVPLWPFGF